LANKDPAFLFYPSDFLTGTMLFTDDEVGKYMRALCYQHQHGHLTENILQRLCDGNANVIKKFVKDDSNNYFNKRLEEEIEKRKKHSEKQRENALKRWNKPNKRKKKCDGNANAMPLENENININEIENIINYLNNKTNRTYNYKAKKNIDVIKARLNEGYTVEQFYQVIDNKVADWLNDNEFNEYLRPETLFSNKFDGYLNKKKIVKNLKDVPLDMSIMED
jgi:uncharacterized phage protein (TIGR02220 family)